MVSKIADFQFVIHKPFVQGFQHGNEFCPYAAVFENRCQTVVLCLIVRQNMNPIAAVGIVVERLGEQVEILVEDGLHGGVEFDWHTALVEHLAAPLAVGSGGHKFVELVTVERHLRDGFGVGPFGCVCADGVYPFNGNRQIIKEINGRIVKKIGNRNPHVAHLAVVDVGDDGNAVGRVLSQLTFNVEGADAVNIIAKEIESERHLIGKRKNIDYASANRVLARLVDEIDALETVIVQQLNQKIVRERVTLADDKGVRRQFFGRNHPFHHGFGVGDHNHRALRRRHLAQHIGAQQNVAAVGALVVHRPLIRRRHKLDVGCAQNGLQIVIQIGRRFHIGFNQHHRPPLQPERRPQHHRHRRALEPLERHHRLPLGKRLHQRLDATVTFPFRY